MIMIELPKKEKCCGCGLCVAICPMHAMTMEEDKYGFSYPSINYDKCISCGKCISTCGFNKINVFGKESDEVFAATCKDDEILKNSTSGGVFAVVAKKVLEKNGIVYGAVWNKDFSVSHIGIEKIDELYKLQGSKYTQSNVYKVFPEIKTYLEKECEVLFSGTPCQVAALYGFLGKTYEKLITIDLICHGVSNSKMFQEDIRYLESKYHDKVQTVAFRTKEKGWGTSGRIVFNKKQIVYDVVSSPYYYYYLKNMIFRDACYRCGFAGGLRQGDLTIGDYWYIESAHPKAFTEESKGVSCILINSASGKKIIDECREDLFLVTSTLEKIKERNGQLVAPSSEPVERKKVLEQFITGDYRKVVSFWKNYSRKDRIIETVKGCIPPKIKTVLKRMRK